MINTLGGLEGHPLSKFAFAKYTVAVTRRHDAEQRSSSMYDAYDPMHPHVSIDNYIADAESVDGEDLVAWVTLPHEHIPRTEDIPLITNYKVHFTLLPWDYHSGNMAMDIPPEPVDNCLAAVR